MSRRRHLRLVTDVVDETVLAVLAAEDLAEELGLDPHARVTCSLHRCWVHQCVSAPDHVIAVTGHRWCRPCRKPVEVLVDETTTRSIYLFCRGCGGTADNFANRRLVQACATSIAAMHRARQAPVGKTAASGR